MSDRYLTFPREDWAMLRAATPLTLREPDLESLTFAGSEVVEVDVKEPVDEIVLNSLDLEIQRARLVRPAKARGKRPPMVVMAVIMIGRKRRSAAVVRASNRSSPWARRWAGWTPTRTPTWTSFSIGGWKRRPS